MEDKDWFWQDDSYKLAAESPLDLETGKGVYAGNAMQEGSPPSKRRRMLLFPGSMVATAVSDPAFDAVLDSSYGSHFAPMIPSCEDYGKYDVAVPPSPSSLWYLHNDDPQISLDEVLEPALTSTMNDYQGPEAYDPTRLIIPVNETSGTSCSSYQQPQPQLQSHESDAEVQDCPATTPFARSPTPGPSPRPNKQFARPRSGTPVVYPFALLKPCGAQGDVTLNDINQRISMPPSRPLPSPTQSSGYDARRSPTDSVVSPGGSPGLSRKPVVALTKIHTEGNGTITIMRTRG